LFLYKSLSVTTVVRSGTSQLLIIIVIFSPISESIHTIPTFVRPNYSFKNINKIEYSPHHTVYIIIVQRRGTKLYYNKHYFKLILAVYKNNEFALVYINNYGRNVK